VLQGVELKNATLTFTPSAAAGEWTASRLACEKSAHKSAQDFWSQS
jgi:hypothetical protein